ncbi:MAG: hypothetical protein JWO60_1219 [Frankiales bacterium]|nr:hypothetical protein [Frankiales bacterium]
MDRRWVQDDDVLVELLDGHALLLRRGGHEVVHLDDVATRVWELLATPRADEDLAAVMASEFGVDRHHVAADVAPLLALLRQQGMVVAAA